MILTLLRHFPTDWNRQGRLQGRSDQPLASDAAAEAALWQVPAAYNRQIWLCSPLQRARQTAELLHPAHVTPLPEWIEMAWGEWEGRRLADLRQELGAEMVALEARGWHFQPPGGESPAEVLARLRQWLASLPPDCPDLVVVSHKGVMRALLAAAWRWDLVGKAPQSVDWRLPQQVGYHPMTGEIIISALNLQGWRAGL